MQLEKHISDLLYRYQCVTVPDFGSFLTQKESAWIDEVTHTLYPPAKWVSFNEQLKANDGLLAKYLSEVLSLSYEESLREIQSQVMLWKKDLAKGFLLLRNIGTLRFNEEGSLQFSPSHHVNYLKEAFGLGSVVSPPILREEYEKIAQATEESTPIFFTPEKRKRRTYWQYAAAAALLLSLGYFGLTKLRQQRQEAQLTEEKNSVPLLKEQVQQATFDMGTLPSLEVAVTEEAYRYHVIAGAFRVEANADKKVRLLEAKGFKAEKLSSNSYGLYPVTFGSYADQESAIGALRYLKRTESKEAWLLVDPQ